jgi:Protein of unknown function (DUF3489)
MAQRSVKTAKENTVLCYAIDSQNQTAAVAANERANLPETSVRFASEKELAAVAAQWPGSRLLEVFNQLPGVKRVAKFTDRKTAVRRIWTALAERAPVPLVAAQEPTKTDRIIAMLREPGGATLKALMAFTGWQNHSIRGFISAHLVKKRSMRIRSFTRNGERVYRAR